MLEIGSYNELTVEREVDFGFYLGTDEDEVLLPSKYVPENLKPGDILTVFIYTDSEDRPIATTLKPHAVVGDCAVLTVKEYTSIGAFMDWGLEKDLLIPKTEQRVRMEAGEKHVVKLCLDTVTDRVYGTTRIQTHCDKVPENLREGEKVSMLIYDTTDIGIMAVVNNTFTGMLYKNETFGGILPGEIHEGYILKVREDGKIDLSLKKPGYSSVTSSSQLILDRLNEKSGFIPLHDKSSPDEITDCLAMSKKEFKRAIGKLYKLGHIDISKDGIKLK